MTNPASPSLTPFSPLGWVGRNALHGLAYLGEAAALLASAAHAAVRSDADDPPLARDVIEQLAWMFRLGLPLVALVHVGLGSFMAMQSYFGGTFVEGTGAVVGVGMLRNIAPMMACLVLGGLLAARITPELRSRRRSGEPASPARAGFLERTAGGARPGREPGRAGPRAARAVAARVAAAVVAGPVLSVWGASVGTAVGWKVSQTMMGVTSHSFFMMFWDMVWLRDVVGLFLKGQIFGLFAALFACHEGLRAGADPDPDLDAVSAAACRAACLAFLTILVVNSGWFILVYHAGPAFGPTLLRPPGS